MRNTMYNKLKIKDYDHWTLYLHECQIYLGRTYLLAKNAHDRDFIDIIGNERDEFFTISKNVKDTLYNLFQPDRINYAALSNVFTQLHIHIIPRYKSPRMFFNINFIDYNWGANFSPYDKSFCLDERIMEKIKILFLERL